MQLHARPGYLLVKLEEAPEFTPSGITLPASMRKEGKAFCVHAPDDEGLQGNRIILKPGYEKHFKTKNDAGDTFAIISTEDVVGIVYED